MRVATLFGLVAATLSLQASALAQGLKEQVAVILRQADTQPLSQTFTAVDRIDQSADEASEDAIRDAVMASIEGLGPRGRLAAAATLRDLDDSGVYGKDIFEVLRPAAKANRDPGMTDAVVAALSMLGDDASFNRVVLADVRELLTELVGDDLTPPEARLAAARSLWEVGSNAERAKAKDTMTAYLRSEDRALQIQGAFALADINTDATGPGWTLIRQLAHEPTADGRRAQLYLKLEEERRRFESTLSELVSAQVDRGRAGKSDRFAVLDELMTRAKAQHIQGEQFTDEDLLSAAAKGMMQFLDRHSTYFSSDEFARFVFDLSREYAGIGAFVNFDQDGDFAIVRPIYSGPAYEVGMRSGDKILEVDGWETAGHTSDEIIKRLKGPPDTTVEVKIFRPGMTEPEAIPVRRRQIQVPSVNSTMLPGDVGYIELVTFGADTARETARAVMKLQREGAKGFVLDVRNNTGGYLVAARDVVELFVPGRKTVVSTRGRDGKPRLYETGDRALTDLPMAVLINGFSASASEITAGALQDHERAVLIGKRSFGKGSVQTLMPVSSQPGEPFSDHNGNGTWEDGEPYEDLNGNGKFDIGPHLKLTVAKYYLPSGRSIHKTFDKEGRIQDPDWGVSPDVELELREVEAKDAWKNAAVFDLFKQDAFRTYVEEHLVSDKETLLELAEGDGGDPSRWPDFDDYYEGLDTQLSKNDIRKWLRYTTRERVADLRGKVYPGTRAMGDIQEDAQLQEAVRKVLEAAGGDIRAIASLQGVLKIPFDENGDRGEAKDGEK